MQTGRTLIPSRACYMLAIHPQASFWTPSFLSAKRRSVLNQHLPILLIIRITWGTVNVSL